MKEISKGVESVDDLFYDKWCSKSSGHLVESRPMDLWTEWQNHNSMVGGLYAVLCFTLLAAWFDPHKIERSVAIKLYFHANLWKRLIEFWPPVQRRPGMQISRAVKYPVLEVKWQQKLWLQPCNNQSRCFDCWEPAKKSPGFAQARAPQTVIKPFAGKFLLLSASH